MTKGIEKNYQLTTPKETPESGNVDRETWLEEVCANFVSTSKANKQYYRVVLEELWPIGHGIPGPIKTQNEIREAIDRYRQATWVSEKPYTQYKDPHRRVRELQGEEGLFGVVVDGRSVQLVNTEVGEKRIPRVKLPDSEWQQILEIYSYRCVNCGRQPPLVVLEQDHKVPRIRGGGNELSNWQPLCTECNNHKSTACRGCILECEVCPWAYPEKYAPLKISSNNIEGLKKLADRSSLDVHELVNDLIAKYLADNTD